MTDLHKLRRPIDDMPVRRACSSTDAAEDVSELQRLQNTIERLLVEMENLRVALQRRDVIGQAKGVLMATIGCTADDAFQRLVEQSQRENRKVVEIAAEIAERASTGPSS